MPVRVEGESDKQRVIWFELALGRSNINYVEYLIVSVNRHPNGVAVRFNLLLFDYCRVIDKLSQIKPSVPLHKIFNCTEIIINIVNF